MKKLILALASFIFCGSVFSQVYLPVVPTTYGQHFQRAKADSAQHIPEKDTLTKNTVDTSAQLFINKKDSLIWAYTKARGFFRVEQSSATGITSGDTAAMLAPYLRIADSSLYATQFDLTLINKYRFGVATEDISSTASRSHDMNDNNFAITDAAQIFFEHDDGTNYNYFDLNNTYVETLLSRSTGGMDVIFENSAGTSNFRFNATHGLGVSTYFEGNAATGFFFNQSEGQFKIDSLPVTTDTTGFYMVLKKRGGTNADQLMTYNIQSLLSAATPSLTSTQIAYGSGSNQMTSSSNLTWDNSGKILKLLDGSSDSYLDVYNTGGTFRTRINGSGFTSIETGFLRVLEQSTPTTPAAGTGVFYFKSDNLPYAKNDAGTEMLLFGGGGGTPASPTGSIQFNNSGSFGGSANLTYNAALLTSVSDGLGSTQTDTKGFVLTNTTAAALGAQQISPSIRWHGNVWSTGGSVNQAVDFRSFVLPNQSGTPFATWKLQSQIDGVGYSDNFTVNSNNQIIIGNGIVRDGDQYALAWNGSTALRGGAVNFSTNAIDSSTNTFMGAGQNTIIHQSAGGAASFMTDGHIWGGSAYAFGAGDANEIKGESMTALGFGNKGNVRNGFVVGNSNLLGSIGGTLGSLNAYDDSWMIGTANEATGHRNGTLGYHIKNTGAEAIIIGMGAGTGSSLLTNSVRRRFGVGFMSDSLTFVVGEAAGIGTYGETGIRGAFRLPNNTYNSGGEIVALGIDTLTGLVYRKTASGGAETDPLSIHLTGTSTLTGNITVDGLTNSKRIFINGKGSGNSGVDIYSEGGNLSLTSNSGVYIGQSGVDSAEVFIAGRTRFNSQGYTASFTMTKDAPLINLRQISSNQTMTFPVYGNDGYMIQIHNQNTSGNSWLVSGSVVKPDGTAITSIPNQSLTWYKFDGITGSATKGSWVQFTDNSGGGGALNLSWDGTNHEVDISGGGTSATIPLATTTSDGLLSTAAQNIGGTKSFAVSASFLNGLSWKSTSQAGSNIMGQLGVRTDGSNYFGIVQFGSDLNAFVGNIIAPSLSANANWTMPDVDATLAGINISNSWADGIKQTFNPNGTNSGINVGSNSGNPSSPANGDIFYESGSNELRARINGAWVALGAGGGSSPNLSWDAVNHEVDISGGGTSAVIPYAATNAEGILSSTTQTVDGFKTFIDGINANGVESFVTTGNTNVINYPVHIQYESTGTPASGFDAGLLVSIETTPGNIEDGLSLETNITDFTATSEDFDFVVKLMAAGATKAEKFRVLSTGEIKVQLVNNDNTETNLVVWNATDKVFEYRTVASLPGGGSAAGSDREIQINNAGAFGTNVWKIDAGILRNAAADGTAKFQADGNALITGTTSDGSTKALEVKAANGASRVAVWTDGHITFNNGTATGNATIEIVDEIAPMIIRNSASNSYTQYAIRNDQNSSARAFYMAYSGSAYASAFLSGGPTGEQGALYTIGAYPLAFGTNNTFRGQFTSGGEFQLAQQIRLPEIATPSTPASGHGLIYFKSDGHAYALNSAGTETDLQAGGGATTFAALTDVNLTSITTNDFLKWDGTDWINRSPTQVRSDLSLVVGTNVQAWDADLDALAAMADGIAARTGAGTYSPRTITGTTNEISVSNGNGVSGNPTLSLSSTLVLGGKLVQIGNLYDANSNEVMEFNGVGSAVNQFIVSNAATGANPILEGKGDNTDVGIDFKLKAAGKFRFLSTTSGPTELRLFEDGDNGANYAGIIAPASLGSDITITLPNASSTLAIFPQQMTFTGMTAARTVTFPDANFTAARTDAAQTFTGSQTFASVIVTNNAVTASGNAATVPVTASLTTVTNNSAATLTITMTTTSAVDGQLSTVRILDATAATQTITWVNTENSSITAPTTSNGSTTLFLTVKFIYNASTSKWRCIGFA